MTYRARSDPYTAIVSGKSGRAFTKRAARSGLNKTNTSILANALAFGSSGFTIATGVAGVITSAQKPGRSIFDTHTSVLARVLCAHGNRGYTRGSGETRRAQTLGRSCRPDLVRVWNGGDAHASIFTRGRCTLVIQLP